MKNSPKTITITLDLYFKGLSMRSIADHINQIQGYRLSHLTVYRWTQRYGRLIAQYTSRIRPKVSQKWHVDEMKVKFGGNWKWLWNVMDKDTRYLLASNITENREVENAREVFALAKEVAERSKNRERSDFRWSSGVQASV
jgi:transposase-like protein